MFSKALGQCKFEPLDNGNSLSVWALVRGQWKDGVRVGGVFASPRCAKDRRSIEATLIVNAQRLPDDAEHGWYEIDTEHSHVRQRWALAAEVASN